MVLTNYLYMFRYPFDPKDSNIEYRFNLTYSASQ